ncbi:MAG: EAL domain-containing protein [Calditerrivibrio sp.]|nr:EAL domain-containing protein [Calditerrivibrio sp.]
MKTFAVCFHHTNEDLVIWREFADYLSYYYGEKFELVTFSSFYEEQVRSSEEDYDLVFQNPETIFVLLQRGYKPFLRFNNQWDTVYYISKRGFKKDKHFIRVGIVPLRVIYSTLLELEKIGFDIDKIDFKIYSNLAEIHNALINGEVDVAITRKDTYTKLSADFRESTEILLEFGMGIFHSFMVKDGDRVFEEKIKEILSNMHNDERGQKILQELGSDRLVEIGYEFKFLDRLNSIGERIFDFRNYRSFFNALDQVSNVGVLIYGKYIKYLNKYAKQLLEYHDYKYINNLETIAVFDSELVKEVEKNVTRRTSGEFFDTTYSHIKMITSTGKKIDVMGFASTIIFQGSPSGVFIFINISRRVFLEKLFHTIKEINHLIIYSEDREELFNRLKVMIVEQMGFNFCKIISFNNSSTPLEYSFGCPIETIDRFKTDDDKVSVHIVSNELSEIKGLIFNVPVFLNGVLDTIIEIHADKYLDYLNELSILMEELKRDVTFTLDRLDKNFRAISFYNAIKSSKDFCFITDKESRIIFINDSVTKISGFSESEIIGKKPSVFKSDKMGIDFYNNLYSKIYKGEQFDAIFINKTKNGEFFYLDASILPIVKKDTIQGFVFIGKNITDEIMLKHEMERLRYEDHLTKAFNFLGFTTKIKEFLHLNPESISAVVMIDIVNMSYINNKYGYDFGNKFLIAIAEELKRILKQRDFIARIGGDDFGVFLANIKKRENIFKIVDRIDSLFKRNFVIDDVSIAVVSKIAVVLYPYDGKDVNDILNKCSLTLSKIRKDENNLRFYDVDLENEAEKFLMVESLISNAIEEKRFVLHFQPYFFARDLSLAGFEALIRMYDREGNILYPNVFIDQLEQSVFLDNFEDWLMGEVNKIIEETGYDFSVNLSAKNLDSKRFFEKFRNLSMKSVEKITIEITERELNDNIDLFGDDFLDFKRRNHIKIAIDDFGTGYSSLLRLKQMPCDIIKIDISFIREMFKTERDTSFVRAIIELANRFQYTTLAEGVETQEQFNYLRRHGCEIVQGYLFSKPIDEKQLKTTNWDDFSRELRRKLSI